MENKYSFKTSETTINDKLSSKYHVTTIKEIQSHTYIHNKESCANFGKPRKTYTKTIDKAKAQKNEAESKQSFMVHGQHNSSLIMLGVIKLTPTHDFW